MKSPAADDLAGLNMQSPGADDLVVYDLEVNTLDIDTPGADD